MIKHLVAWASDGNLSGFYNRELLSLPSESDWCLFQDRDVYWPHPHFFKHINEVIQKHGNKFDVFVPMMNRIGTDWMVNQRMSKIENGKEHENCSVNMWRGHGSSIEDVTDRSPISGAVILAKKALITEGRKLDDGLLLGADNQFTYIARESGKRIGLMKGIYVYHYYRNNIRSDSSHLNIS